MRDYTELKKDLESSRKTPKHGGSLDRAFNIIFASTKSHYSENTEGYDLLRTTPARMDSL